MAKIELESPGAALLAMEHEIGPGDLVWLEQRVRSALGKQRLIARRADLAIDDDMATWIPLGPSSRAMLCATARRPNFGEARLTKPAPPLSEAVAPVKMMVPCPALIMRCAASRPTRKPEKQPTRQQRSNSTGSVSLTVPR
jgi:hypothetical protein